MNDKNSEETVGFTVSPEQFLAGKIVTVPEKGFFYLDLEKAREYYLKGGVHKEIALQAGYTEEELTPVKNEWESKVIDHGNKFVSGWYLGSDSVYKETNEENTDKSTFRTEKHAVAALAYAQLTHIMALPEYNGDWVPDWINKKQEKWCICRQENDLVIRQFAYTYSQIALKSRDLAIVFKANNLDLIKQFNEMD